MRGKSWSKEICVFGGFVISVIEPFQIHFVQPWYLLKVLTITFFTFEFGVLRPEILLWRVS